jgi:hypothetical protein
MNEGEISPSENWAAKNLASQTFALVEFMSVLSPDLYKHEAMLLAASFIDQLPGIIQANPGMQRAIAQGTQAMIDARTI